MIIDNFRLLFTNLKERITLNKFPIVFGAFFLRLVFQSVYFVVLARTFNPDKYGSFIAIIATTSLFIPFANWGSNRVLIQNVSRDQSLFAEYYGTAILKTLIFGSGFIAVILVFSALYPIPNISIYSAFFIALANLVFMPLGDNCRDAFASVGLLGYSANIILFLSTNRFLGALILITLVKVPTLIMWSVIYCVATLVTAIVASIMVVKLIGYPKFKFSRVFQDLKLGFSFSVGDSAENIYNDLDKAMLAKLSTVEATAIYGVAYHILNVSYLPIKSLMYASYKDFFKFGASGIQASLAFCRKILPISVGFSIFIIILIFLFSPLIPKIIGDGYINSTTALIWLSPTILFNSLHRLAADTLTGANYQKLRSIAQVSAAFFNGIINIWLISHYQWLGAIWATLITEFLLMVLLWGLVYKYHREDHKSAMAISCKR